MARPAPAEVTEPTATKRKWSWRPWLLVLGILALIVAALGGTYAWTQSQYFVGHAGANVAIFRGVNTEFGPLKFFNIYRVTDLPVADLNPSVRSQVHDGITASSKGEAEHIVRNLRDQQLPACRPTPSPSSSGLATSASTSSSRSAASSKSAATAKSSARTSATAGAKRTPTSTPTATPSSPPASPSPQPTCPVPVR
jgi:protein phosphatase